MVTLVLGSFIKCSSYGVIFPKSQPEKSISRSLSTTPSTLITVSVSPNSTVSSFEDVEPLIEPLMLPETGRQESKTPPFWRHVRRFGAKLKFPLNIIHYRVT
jgi:hypothetical protein